LEDPGIDGG